MSGGVYYFPRALVNITVPVAGSSSQKQEQESESTVVNWTMPPTRLRLTFNDHNEADTAEVGADWSYAGLDPRMITDGTVTIFADDVRPGQNLQPSRANTVFNGILVRPRRSFSATGWSSTLVFHDFTSFFLREKPFVSAGLPDYSMTLSQAWARICDHVGPTDEDGKSKSVVSALRNLATGPSSPGLVFEGGASDVLIGKAVAKRFRGTPIAKEITDAWAVWQQVVGMLGLISFIRLDQCVVTTATDWYSAEGKSARFIYGRNILEIDQDRDIVRSQQGVIVESFDPLTGTTVEGIWPPFGDTRVRKKHLTAKKAASADGTLQAEDRIVYAVPSLSDPDVALEVAKRAYEERSRQELVGRVVTPYMRVPASDETDPGPQGDGTYSLLGLDTGQVVRIEIEKPMLETILGLGSTEARVARLEEYGYVREVAEVLVANLAGYAALSPKFLVTQVVVELDFDPAPGHFSVEVEFCNRINVDGSAT